MVVLLLLQVKFSTFSTASCIFVGSPLTPPYHNPKQNSQWCVHLCTQLTGKAVRAAALSLQL